MFDGAPPGLHPRCWPPDKDHKFDLETQCQRTRMTFVALFLLLPVECPHILPDLEPSGPYLHTINVRMSRFGANAQEYTSPDHTYLSQRMASPFSRMSVIHDINSHLCMENKTCCVHTSRGRASLIHVFKKRPNLV